MAGSGGANLKEQLAKATVRNVKLKGHTYIDLRRDGKRSIFFCTLCLAPCYSDSILYHHLKGSLHCKRLAAAKATLLKPNPWPFHDGVLFFDDTSEQDVKVPKRDSIQLLDNICQDDERNLAMVSYDGSMDSVRSRNGSSCEAFFHKNEESVVAGSISRKSSCLKSLADDDSVGNQLVIPGVLCKGGISQLEVTYLGVGQIAARFCEKNGILSKMQKIWCEWLGGGDLTSEDTLAAVEHDFAIVTFSYDYDLGRKGMFDDVRFLLPSSPHSELDEHSRAMNRKRKSLSDLEDVSESLTAQYDSSGEECQPSKCSNRMMLLDGCDDQLLNHRVLASKSMRKELRRQQEAASERMCDICQHIMLPGKDVAALLNKSTGRLACSTRNLTGAFHVFHVSCLIHWILLCEMEIYEYQLNAPKVKRRSRRKLGAKQKEVVRNNEMIAVSKQKGSSFCPECQGTGVNSNIDELEKPTVPLSKMFRYKIKATDCHRAWMKSPELLPNCSTGFCLPDNSEVIQEETVLRLKLLQFYRATDKS